MMIVAFGGTENSATQIAAIIMAGASVIAYIIGEGLTDAANAGTDNTIENESDEEE
jgi:D-arabinose 1-dehydrogenase-like Zn-dependent alcohol dehydrogenase